MRIFIPSSVALLLEFEDVRIWVIFIISFNFSLEYKEKCFYYLKAYCWYSIFVLETLSRAWNNRITNWVDKMGPMYHPGFYFDDAVAVSS
jgi:hypothetical protein